MRGRRLPLSRPAGAPVRLVLDRREEQLDSRQPAGDLAAPEDRRTQAMARSARSRSPPMGRPARHRRRRRQYRAGDVRVPELRYRAIRRVHQCGPRLRDARARAIVPGAFALEQIVDELAEKLDIDPLVLRDRIDASPVRREERRRSAPSGSAGATVTLGRGYRPGQARHRMAQSLWGANVQTNAACEVRILRDGSVEVLSSVQDIGTGIGTVLAQVVAEEFGLRVDDITVRIGDTDFPAGPPSYGSRTTASITPPARNAAYQVLQMLFEVAASHLTLRPRTWSLAVGALSQRPIDARHELS